MSAEIVRVVVSQAEGLTGSLVTGTWEGADAEARGNAALQRVARRAPENGTYFKTDVEFRMVYDLTSRHDVTRQGTDETIRTHAVQWLAWASVGQTDEADRDIAWACAVLLDREMARAEQANARRCQETCQAGRGTCPTHTEARQRGLGATTGTGVERLRFSEWMKRERPDGRGRIVIGGPEGVTDIIEFDDVVCDHCNTTIPAMQDDGTETVVGVDGDDALCPSCTVRREARRNNGPGAPYIEEAG